ncbi:hypothetical protein [Candidatus Nitrosopumilus sp. SW]|nr:hypothetical protein [Candidatus Nitrosopumilus sp. SW]
MRNPARHLINNEFEMDDTPSKRCDDCKRMRCSEGCMCDCHPKQAW